MLKRLSYPLTWVEGLTGDGAAPTSGGSVGKSQDTESAPNTGDSNQSVFSKVFSRYVKEDLISFALYPQTNNKKYFIFIFFKIILLFYSWKNALIFWIRPFKPTPLYIPHFIFLFTKQIYTNLFSTTQNTQPPPHTTIVLCFVILPLPTQLIWFEFIFWFDNCRRNTFEQQTQFIKIQQFKHQFAHYFGLRVGWQFIFQNTVRRFEWLSGATTDTTFYSFWGSLFDWVRNHNVLILGPDNV